MGRLTRKSRESEMVWFIDRENDNHELEPCEMGPHNSEVAIRRLAEYEDAEEKGLLLKLPCKTGDKVYFVHRGVNCISESEIDSVEIKKGVIWVKTITKNYFLNTAIGKTVFLTKEEAEQKLEELQTN